MKRTTIPPAVKFTAIVMGPLDAAVDAAWRYTGSVLRSNGANGYGGLHCTVRSDAGGMREWFRDTHDRGPGALLWYE